MSNQVHPYLVDQNFPDDDDSIDVSLKANSYRENVNQLVLSKRNSLNNYIADRQKSDIEEDDEEAIFERRNSANNIAVARRKSDQKKYTVRSSTRKLAHTWLDKSSDGRCVEENSGNAYGEQDKDRSEADTDMEDDKQANGSRWNSTNNNASAIRKFHKRKKLAVISNALKHAHIKSDNFSDLRYAKENSAHARNLPCAPDADRKFDEKRKCSLVRSRTRKATHTQLKDSSNAGCVEENTGNARYADDDQHKDQSSEADTDSEGKKQANVPRNNLPNNNVAAMKKSGKKRKN
ncbi:hypothetical protein MA16_Dca025626 [Dendrobium catenatum]|uniref:Uncharacterized protein n=1 Tax=Dendrobium catenatum TaxID=906689 RepID=A0A2I0VW19_9ASPA|nr:hypothetical protein MA16_Dca025626 [Dendrobium catenatum]